jgi:hypothetical protein
MFLLVPNYYPTYYTAWNYPVFRYRNNININLNFNNSYITFQQDTALVQWLYTIQEDRMATKDILIPLLSKKFKCSYRYELDQSRGTRTATSYSNSSDTNRELTSRRTGRDNSEK